jgi:hypothetical protein
MKQCKDCGKTLSLDSFYVHKEMADGHLNKCKTCVKSRMNRHRESSLEAAREYDRQRADLPHRVELRKAYQQTDRYRQSSSEGKKRYAARNPEKRRAQSLVAYQIRLGNITRQPCQVCGEAKSEAHHEDYSSPLDVMWLCDTHHKARHREINAERRRNSA